MARSFASRRYHHARRGAPRRVSFRSERTTEPLLFTHTSARTHPHRAMWDRRASTSLSACVSCPCAAVVNGKCNPEAGGPERSAALHPAQSSTCRCAHCAAKHARDCLRPRTAARDDTHLPQVHHSCRAGFSGDPSPARVWNHWAHGLRGAASGNGAQAGTGVRRVHSQAARRIADRRRWARCEKGVGALRREAMVL